MWLVQTEMCCESKIHTKFWNLVQNFFKECKMSHQSFLIDNLLKRYTLDIWGWTKYNIKINFTQFFFYFLNVAIRKLKIIYMTCVCDSHYASFGQHWSRLLVYETKSNDMWKGEKSKLPLMGPHSPVLTVENKFNKYWPRALWWSPKIPTTNPSLDNHVPPPIASPSPWIWAGLVTCFNW